jgi:ribosome production factor 2
LKFPVAFLIAVSLTYLLRFFRKPKNARSRRALEKREQENPCKRALFLRGTTCSQIVQDALADLYTIKNPWAKKFTKKNSIHPFEDPSSLEFFSEKNDCSILVFGSSSKKRPNTITLCRTFNHKVLDMLELYLDGQAYRRINQFKTQKFAVGLRPMLLFMGTAFESPVSNEWTMAKSLLMDLFRGEPADSVDVEGLRYMIVVSADEEGSQPAGDGADAKPVLHLRVYLIRTKRSGHKLPRIELEEQGPRMDFRLGRMRAPDEAMLKEAMKQPKTSEERTKKNIAMNTMGDKMGRIHLGRQDLSELQTRKMKGLKRDRNESEYEDGQQAISEAKRKR